ncbi:hypothetical protein EVAR_87857_1 [Eumeta japonica]|uniref:Uncharacterized protein n=1 Tax=Eumeta variegata TaxID=151549 RepID=A0A4C1WXP1_EUMVA|nr:hypothetical protein EVAR_87857_1 [Eumeta japonica]
MKSRAGQGSDSTAEPESTSRAGSWSRSKPTAKSADSEDEEIHSMYTGPKPGTHVKFKFITTETNGQTCGRKLGRPGRSVKSRIRSGNHRRTGAAASRSLGGRRMTSRRDASPVVLESFTAASRAIKNTK